MRTPDKSLSEYINVFLKALPANIPEVKFDLNIRFTEDGGLLVSERETGNKVSFTIKRQK